MPHSVLAYPHPYRNSHWPRAPETAVRVIPLSFRNRLLTVPIVSPWDDDLICVTPPHRRSCATRHTPVLDGRHCTDTHVARTRYERIARRPGHRREGRRIDIWLVSVPDRRTISCPAPREWKSTNTLSANESIESDTFYCSQPRRTRYRFPEGLLLFHHLLPKPLHQLTLLHFTGSDLTSDGL